MKIFYILLLILVFPFTSLSQTQKGLDIVGENINDFFGTAVCMPNENTIAVGGINNNGNGTNAGHVRIYTWDNNNWVQKGNDIDGEAANDKSGFTLSMPNENTIAIGSPFNDDLNSNAGHVRIFNWNSATSTWVQKGTDINGVNANDLTGWAVSMPDANTVAIGETGTDLGGTGSGQVRIFTWNGNSWLQKGALISGENAHDEFGTTISMPDTETIAIGAINYQGTAGSGTGQVSIYKWNNNTTNWELKGNKIEGNAIGMQLGSALDMPDANTLAIGAPQSDVLTANSGQVQVYTWQSTNNTWVIKGVEINGTVSNEMSGSAISMPNANTIAVGAFNNSDNGVASGKVTIYEWQTVSNLWVQKGTLIKGLTNDRLGFSVCMPNVNTIGIGAPINLFLGNSAGKAVVYQFDDLSINKNNYLSFNVYPNPSSKTLTITSNEVISLIEIFDITGKKIYETNKTEEINIESLTNGVYILKVYSNDKSSSLKFIKK